MKKGGSCLDKRDQTGADRPRLVPMLVIRRFARHIAERFHPDRIILFGSYAYGTPTPDSDVDLLVVMPTRNQIEQAVRIDEAIDDRAFALDLLVRTPNVIEDRLRWGDWFIKEIMERGKVLYELRASGSAKPKTPSAPLANCLSSGRSSVMR